MLVQTAGLAVAPVNGPPDHASELVCPAAGALSVALEGVAATAEDTISISATKVGPTHFPSCISSPPEEMNCWRERPVALLLAIVGRCACLNGGLLRKKSKWL